MLLYNSLTNKKEEFIPLQKSKVVMYVCGITPYDTTHLGHAFTYIFFDVLYRYLTHKGYTVIYTQNVTDVNDRDNDILKRAREENKSWQELSSFWTQRFLSDMKNLNWIMPQNYLKASEQINHMTGVIQKIIDNGYAYKIGNNVYLDIARVETYGRLSKLSEKEMFERAKEFEEDLDNKQKKHPLDITLWRETQKNQLSHIPSFPSPFGNGRPGWHIECSTMAISSLGEQIDIHGGGIDLIYPHHESEIAQSEAATKKMPFAKYWLHTYPVTYKGKKMSKSLGNLIMVSDLLQKFSAQTIKFYLLLHHYREQWEYNQNELLEIEIKVSMIKSNFQYEESRQKNADNALLMQFNLCMENDMDTKGAINYIFDLSRKAKSSSLHRRTLNACLSILGISF